MIKVFAPALLSLLLLMSSACLRTEHNYTAAERLVPGMPGDGALAALSEKGAYEIEAEIERPASGGWASVLDDERALEELLEAERTIGRPVARCICLHRFWGYLGYGTFWLFLDSDDVLLGYHLFHIN